MKKIKIISRATVIFLVVTSTLFAAENKVDEMLSDIQDTLLAEDEVLNYIPELKRQKGKDGKEFYTYNIKGQEVRLEDLDKTKLENIFRRVHQTATKIRADRISQQNETIRQAQRAQQLIQLQSRTSITRPTIVSPTPVTPANRIPTPPPPPPVQRLPPSQPTPPRR